MQVAAAVLVWRLHPAVAICISTAATILKVSVKNLVFSTNILVAGS